MISPVFSLSVKFSNIDISLVPNTDKPGANGKSNSNKRPRREEIDDEREARKSDKRSLYHYQI